LAQDGDARYLALEVLSGVISTAADVFSLGLAAMELASDYDMPVTGDLWSDIRELKLPLEVTTGGYTLKERERSTAVIIEYL
jgi:hypothetical protein